MYPSNNSKNQFVNLSAFLTGFTRAELEGTGLADAYYGVVNSIIASDILGALLLSFQTNTDNKDIDSAQINEKNLTDPEIGPVCKNIITLWYLGQWNQMPMQWRNQYGANALDRDHIISAQSYKQGLVWSAMGAHPMGTKQQGYGAWSFPPPDSPV